MAITWRNIESDTTRGVADLMEVARGAFNDGLGNFKGIVDARNQLNQANWDQQRANNTNAFLDRLAQYKTPEELAAAQASGELQALRQQYGGQVDATAIRDAEANRADVLMKRIAAQNQYGDDKINRDARPLMEQYQGMLAQGNATGAAKFLADNRLSVDESGALQDLQNLQKTQFSQDIQRSNLALSERADQRAQTQFDDNMNETLQKRAVLGGVQSSLSGSANLADAKGRFSQWAKENNLRADHVTAGLSQLTQLYTDQTGLTEEQDAAVSAYVAPYEKAAKLAEEQASGFKAFTNPEVKNMTESQALAKVLPRVKGEEDDTLDTLQTKVAEFRKKFKVPETVNLGAVLNEVLSATGKDEAIVGDDELDLDKFEDSMKRVYGEFQQYEATQNAARQARTYAETEKMKKQNEFRKGNIANILR
ncbi:MAG: hypothetical protein B7X50_08615 [Alishewanella sp. 34-51-39]|nr:MAG: hypothetical protein B7X50_08615 [Alishewanella sp. 34-51-39]